MNKTRLSMGLLALVALVSTLRLHAQTSDQTPFQKYFADCTAGKSADVPKEVRADSKEAKHWLSSMEKPLMGTGKRATCAIDGIFDIARHDKENKSVGRIAVNLLTGKLEQGGYNDYIVDRMTDFPSSFFLEIHKERINALAQKKETQHRAKLIELLVGLNYEPAMSLALEEMKNPSIPKSRLFKYHVIFAKRSSQESIDWLSQELSGKKINTDAVHTVVPMIISTKQKSLIQWVVNGLDEPEELCYSSDDKKGHCGYLILEYLAPAIKDFPIKADEEGLITDDPKQALTTAREWFKNNPNYRLL